MAQATTVPTGYAEGAQAPPQDAIAPYATLTITGTPDWDAVLKEADALYDRLAEQDIEGRLAQMRFPS